MSNQIPILFDVFGSVPIGSPASATSVAIADVCSDKIELCYDYVWFLQVFKSGADGNPLVTIEASNDCVHWDTWSECMKEAELDSDSCSFHDHYFGAKYLRLCIDANGTTTGTITALLNLRKP